MVCPLHAPKGRDQFHARVSGSWFNFLSLLVSRSGFLSRWVTIPFRVMEPTSEFLSSFPASPCGFGAGKSAIGQPPRGLSAFCSPLLSPIRSEIFGEFSCFVMRFLALCFRMLFLFPAAFWYFLRKRASYAFCGSTVEGRQVFDFLSFSDLIPRSKNFLAHFSRLHPLYLIFHSLLPFFFLPLRCCGFGPTGVKLFFFPTTW